MRVKQPHPTVIPANAGIPLLLLGGRHEGRLGVYHERRYRGTTYVGVTAHIASRAMQHRSGEGAAFCRRYNLTRLVYAEFAEDIQTAIAREKALKKWRRAWKIDLIESVNPDWLDLFKTINGGAEEAGSPRSRG